MATGLPEACIRRHRGDRLFAGTTTGDTSIFQEAHVMIGRQGFRRAVTLLAAGAFVAIIPATARAQSEGIKVHGRWAIEVQNSDGTVAQKLEFNNALSGGHQTLAALLSRNGVPGRWAVFLGNSSGGISPCQGGSGAAFGSFCKLIESAAINFNGGTGESRDLVVTGATTSVSMTGTITALVDGSITRVATGLGTCGALNLISACNAAGGALFFSDASLGFAGYPPPVNVVAGQIIKVTVTFTFS
jgi:hypothetical protein